MTNVRTDQQSLPSLEATHSWKSDSVIFGDNQGAFPRVKVKKIDGLYSLAEMDDQRDKVAGRIGEVARPSIRRGKTITYEGEIQAKTLEALRYLTGVMRGALSDPSEGLMRIVPNAAYGGNIYRYTARCISFEPVEEQTRAAEGPVPFARSFVAAFRMSDPRFSVEPLINLAGTAGSGSNDPTVALANIGTAPVDPLLAIYGPVVSPRVQRSSGARLWFTGTIAAGHWLEIDFARRTLLYDGVTDWTPNLDLANSNWWDSAVDGIPVGGATATLSKGGGGNPGAGSYVRAIYYPAIW